MPRKRQPVRGLWEREPGSDIWWIRYRAGGGLKREKVGAWGTAFSMDNHRHLRHTKALSSTETGQDAASLKRSAHAWRLEHYAPLPFPFSARQAIAVRCLPADSPRSKNETSRDNHCWPKFLLIDLVSVIADLRTFVSGSHAMSPVNDQPGSLPKVPSMTSSSHE